MRDKDGNIKPTEGKATDSMVIWDLDGLPDNKLDSNTLFFVSRPLQQTVFRSYNIGYNSLSVDIYHQISAFPNVELSGRWEFSEQNGGGLSANYKITDDEEDVKLVLNAEYLSTRFLIKLAALSTEIFDANHMPSYVGQVIYSTSLRTLEKVQKYYGTYTQWEPVEGRFIMASAHDGSVGKTTGDFQTQLSINDTPKHSHMVTAEDNPKTTRLNWTISPSTTTICKQGGASTGRDGGYSGSGMFLVVTNYPMKDAVEWTGATEREDWRDGRVAVIYSADKPMHGKGGAKVTVNQGQNQPHNNIPPFVTVFAWKRTK